MKTFRPLPYLISCVLISIVFIQACTRKSIDEIKVPDFKTLESQFLQPPAEYTTSPFFVWNGDINEEEVDKDLESFKNAGSSQVFIHPRPGLITEYLSQDWFEYYKHTVEKAKELGMKVWIYDENSYPSGFGGGHVPDEMPESYNQGQGLRMVRTETLPDISDKYYICLKEENGRLRDITGSIKDEKGKPGNYILFSKTYYSKSDWYGGFTYVDLLYPGVTEKFIDITMTGYELNLGSEFGLTIPGTFTDEPQINSPGGIRWTPELFKVFKEKWHYDLRLNLPSLFEEVGDWKKVRHNYTQTLLQMFIDRWAEPWYTYCEQKGLKFTGHYWEHEWPNMRPGGDNMAMYAWHHVPAIDMLFNQWNDSTPRAQFGNVRAVKELASAANQRGRQRKLSETYGGSGWELTFAEMKRNGDWEYALGVNLMNQHLTYFTMAGARKYDYPPTFDYHEPWWNNYKYLNDHYARLSLALSSGKQVNDILIIEPTTSAWLYDSYVKRNPKNTEIGQSFQTFITTLEKQQVEYDLGSENIIKDYGSVITGKLVVGEAEYSKVVLPPMTENIDLATYRLLERFVANGGKLIVFSVPTLIDGSTSKSLEEFFTKQSEKIVFAKRLSNEFISSHLNNNNIRFEESIGGNLYHHRRILEDGQIIFLANSSMDESLSGTLNTSGTDALELNTLTGHITHYPNIAENSTTSISYSIPPAGSLLLFVSNTATQGYTAAPQVKVKHQVAASSDMEILVDEPNALMIDFCDLTMDGNTYDDLIVVSASDNVFKNYGFKNGNPWNHSVQFKTNIVDRDTFGVNTGFTAKYHFRISGKFDLSNLRAVVERPDIWKVSINGTEVAAEPGSWWLDRSFGVFDISSFAKTGDNTITLDVSPMKINAEVEPVYILGNFSVKPADKGFQIEKPVAGYRTGSWKSQGLPFYSWGVTYSKEYNIDNIDGKWELALGKWNGTIAEVRVNGKLVSPIAFPPWVSDLSALMKPGMNKIDVKVIGSLKNLLGPHHNNPAPGLSSPGSWRNVKYYPPGKDYQMLDYGLMEDFVLTRGE